MKINPQPVSSHTVHSPAMHQKMTTNKGYWAGGKLVNPKGAKPMSDPNLDMSTWKPPKQEMPMQPMMTPEQRSRIQTGKSKLA